MGGVDGRGQQEWGRELHQLGAAGRGGREVGPAGAVAANTAH